jgi:hypothetical protein
MFRTRLIGEAIILAIAGAVWGVWLVVSWLCG